MDAFSCLTLLALGAIPLLVSLLATCKAIVVVVPAIPLCFHTGSLGILARVVLACSTSLRLGPRNSHRPTVTPFCFLPTFSIIGLNYSLAPLLLGNNVGQRVRVMRYEIETHIPFHLAAELECGSIPAVIASTSTLPCFSVYCRPSGFTTFVSPLLQGISAGHALA